MVLIESDFLRRERLARGLRDAGMPVVAVGSIAELERWPAGDVVITESSQFTAWWQQVGAAHVVVLADNQAQAARCCRLGATVCLARWCALSRLVAALRSLDVKGTAGVIAAGSVLHEPAGERASVVH